MGQRYSAAQYGAGGLLVLGITLFTAGDARGAPNFSPIGVGLITLALVRPGRGRGHGLGWGARVQSHGAAAVSTGAPEPALGCEGSEG